MIHNIITSMIYFYTDRIRIEVNEMRVKCMICLDKKRYVRMIENPIGKKLRNRPIHTYMCMECSERIAGYMERMQGVSSDYIVIKKIEDDWLKCKEVLTHIDKNLFIFFLGSRFIYAKKQSMAFYTETLQISVLHSFHM